MKRILFVLSIIYSFAFSKCDIPEPYSSLCNYEQYKYSHVPNDTFGFASDRLDVYLDGNTRFPAQELLGFALAGNTDAMQKLAGAFENKDWRDYWYKKIFETRGINKPIPPLQLEKMPQSDQDAYKNKQSSAIKEMSKKADNLYIKDKLNCWLAQYDKSISMEELAKGGSECAIMAMARQDVISADKLKQQGQPYKIDYNLQKILSLSDSVYAYETAIECYSWRNKRDSGIPTVCEDAKPDRDKVLKYIDLYVKAYAKKLESQSAKDISYKIKANNVKFYKLRDTARDVLRLGYNKNNQAMIEDAIFYYKEALKVPMESTMSKDIALHELAIVLDPASQIYQKASMKKVVELFYPDINLPINKRSSCDSSDDKSGCAKLFLYLTKASSDKPSGLDKYIDDEYFKLGTYRFGLENTYFIENYSQGFKNEYIRNTKSFGIEKELNSLGLFIYSSNNSWIALGNKSIIERRIHEETIQTKDNIVGSLSSFIDGVKQESLANFYKSRQVNDKYLKIDVSKLNPAKYYFDRYYLNYLANNIKPIYLEIKSNNIHKNNNERIDVKINFTPVLKQSFQKLKIYSENCYGAKENSTKIDEIFAECNINPIFDRNKLEQINDYKKARENGSIYALIADGTLKPKTIRDNSKNEIKEFIGIERYWIYSPNLLGNINNHLEFLFSNISYQKNFDIEWLIEALDKYEIKHNFVPFYGNERPSYILIDNLPKELE